jgi:aldose 1-epimerase
MFMKIERKVFGTLSDGTEAYIYTLEAGELKLCLTNYGGTLLSLFVPDKNGVKADVLLGFSTLGPYTSENKGWYFGNTIGRYGNRIGGAKFTLDGKEYKLCANDNGHSLHGGQRGFGQRLWESDGYEAKEGVFVRLTRKSPDGEEGFPGNLNATVTYGLLESNELVMDYQAELSADCPVNLTNHSYFNLAGEGNGDILDHLIQIYGSRYVEVDDTLIPTGQLAAVKDTPFDLLDRKPIRAGYEAAKGGPGKTAGYDHCWVIDGDADKPKKAAAVYEPRTGRIMFLATTQPGIQFYTGNFLDGVKGKQASVYGRHAGFCLETQHLPDSPNQPAFPSCVFGPKKPYHQTSIFSFDWQ